MAEVAQETLRAFLERVEGTGAQEAAWFDSIAAALAAESITVPSELAGAKFEDFRFQNAELDGGKKRCVRLAIKMAGREKVGVPARRARRARARSRAGRE